jgi:hypothetical protein
MSDSASNPAAHDALGRDLALVMPGLGEAAGADISAWIDGREAPRDAALDRCTDLIARSRAPAIVGLNHLTIEAIRETILLAEQVRGRLLPYPTIGHRLTATQPVTQGASLGHVLACEMIVWVGCAGESGPIAERIAERQPLASFVEASLGVVQRLRSEWKDNQTAEPIGRHKRVAVVLSWDCDPRVTSQWHKLAAQIQDRVRLSVFTLPNPETSANSRGVVETITWQTGVSPIGGGIDFADGSPRACGSADELLNRRVVDLLIDTTPAGIADAGVPRITIGPRAVKDAAVSWAVPGPARGMAARVIRCDSVVLWLCDDPAAAPSDPAVSILAQLAEKSAGTK